MSTDCQFPYIKYRADWSPLKNGQAHGESFRRAIGELFSIRRELMLAKNPRLKPKLSQLAKEQWEASLKYDLEIAEEMQGIAQGSGLDLDDIVILNNYTDFRDITLADEGCSTIGIKRGQTLLAGQTWDMHSSAKNYMCMIHAPARGQTPEALILSLVGCVGLMGVNTHLCTVGVNNINTKNARAALIWPLLVRSLLKEKDLPTIEEKLMKAPVTSGHNYIVADKKNVDHFEVTPTSFEKVAWQDKNFVFHTNHCLTPSAIEIEERGTQSSTTMARYELLSKKAPRVETFEELQALLQDHESHPMSICSHFESGAQDPSMTCAGGIVNQVTGDTFFWRGCPTFDENYRNFKFKLEGSSFVKN